MAEQRGALATPRDLGLVPRTQSGVGMREGVCSHTETYKIRLQCHLVAYTFNAVLRKKTHVGRTLVYGYGYSDPISQNIPKYSNKEVCRYCQSLYFYCLSTMHETRFICEQDIDKHMFVYSCGSVKIFSVVK